MKENAAPTMAVTNRRLGPGDTNRFPIENGHLVYVHSGDPPAKGMVYVSDDIHGTTGKYAVPLSAIDFLG